MNMKDRSRLASDNVNCGIIFNQLEIQNLPDLEIRIFEKSRRQDPRVKVGRIFLENLFVIEMVLPVPKNDTFGLLCPK